MSIIEQIDSSPLMKMLTGILFEDGPKLLGRAAAGVVNVASGVVNDGLSAIKDSVTTVGSAISIGRDGAEISPVRAVAQEIQAPARSTAVQEVNMADIGTFSPPSFSSGGQEIYTGRG